MDELRSVRRFGGRTGRPRKKTAIFKVTFRSLKIAVLRRAAGSVILIVGVLFAAVVVSLLFLVFIIFVVVIARVGLQPFPGRIGFVLFRPALGKFMGQTKT